MSVEWKGERLGVLEMRRHYANYFKGMKNFKPVRTALVEIDEYAELQAVLRQVAADYSDADLIAV
jgi:tRNA-dihydrouridine synthase